MIKEILENLESIIVFKDQVDYEFYKTLTVKEEKISSEDPKIDHYLIRLRVNVEYNVPKGHRLQPYKKKAQRDLVGLLYKPFSEELTNIRTGLMSLQSFEYEQWLPIKREIDKIDVLINSIKNPHESKY